MAAPPVPRGTNDASGPASKFIGWVQKTGQSLARPLFAVLLALIAGGLLIIFTSPGSPGDRLGAVVSAYHALYIGSFGDSLNFSDTLVKVTPLILAGLSVALAYRAGLFNIGAGGQIAVGATAAAIVAYRMPTLPGWLLIPLMILASIFAGGIWGGIVGFLKAWRGAHEVVTTIMLNWIAFYGTDYLINGPFQAPEQASQTPSLPEQATLPALAPFYNQTLGTILPPIPDASSYLVDVSFLFALLVLVFYWFITSRTAFGYEIRVIGQNLKAARYAGIPIKRNFFLVMAIAGAFSGLAGSFHLMGQPPYYLTATSFSIDPTGFDAIGVALLGHTTAPGVLVGSLLFGGLRQGGGSMQLDAHIPGDLVYIIQALVLFSIASEFLPVLQRAVPNLLRNTRKPALAPNIVGPSVDGSFSELDGEKQKDSDNERTKINTVPGEQRSDRVEEV
jgi:ABC-type uncharacterized transport system permease subunit